MNYWMFSAVIFCIYFLKQKLIHKISSKYKSLLHSFRKIDCFDMQLNKIRYLVSENIFLTISRSHLLSQLYLVKPVIPC